MTHAVQLHMIGAEIRRADSQSDLRNFVIVVIKDIRDPGCFLDYKRISLTKLKSFN